MAVVQKYGKSYKNPSLIALALAVFGEGQMRSIVTGSIAVANGDSINSEIFFGKLPSNAILLPISTVYHGGLTGVTDFDIGLKRDGVLVDIDCYADGLNLTSAGTKSGTAALATGSIGRRAWEVAGLSSDPGGEFDLVGTFKAAASADGVLEAVFYYAKK